MFDKPYDQRLSGWAKFRETLEVVEDPLRATVEFYKLAPNVSVHVNPWDRAQWPSPWELVHENMYCDFTRVLGMCYSLQLTDRFKGSCFEIHISTSNNLACIYLLYVDDYILGYDDNDVIHKNKLPKEIQSQQTYRMSDLQ
jgi:hypothetical protein